jgi:hypothetical protein
LATFCPWGLCSKKLPTFERLWDDFIQEEMRLETVASMEEEEQNLALINKMKKGNKKGGPGKGQKGKKEDSSSSNQGKKDLSHIKCFKCQKFGHFASQCHEKKGKGKQQ